MMFDFEVWKVFKFTIWDQKSILYNSAIIINVTNVCYSCFDVIIFINFLYENVLKIIQTFEISWIECNEYRLF